VTSFPAPAPRALPMAPLPLMATPTSLLSTERHPCRLHVKVRWVCGLGWGAHLLSTAVIRAHLHCRAHARTPVPIRLRMQLRTHVHTINNTHALALCFVTQVMSARSFPPGDFGSLGTKKGYVRLTCFTQTAQ
jgi:hypothetical protein